MGVGCFDIAEIITHLLGQTEVREEIREVEGNPGAIPSVLGRHLDSEKRELWRAEAETMPPGVMRHFGQAVSDAVREDLTFRFEGTPPDDVMGSMRDRVIEVSYRYSETEIVARMSHTMRHPTWLPELRAADLAEV